MTHREFVDRANQLIDEIEGVGTYRNVQVDDTRGRSMGHRLEFKAWLTSKHAYITASTPETCLQFLEAIRDSKAHSDAVAVSVGLGELPVAAGT